MKNFTRWLFGDTALTARFFKISNFISAKFFPRHILAIILLSFLTLGSNGQSYTDDIPGQDHKQVSPALESIVRNTLKQSSLKLQLVENNGQMGLPENVAAYFSSGNQIIFVEKNRL